MKFNQKKAIEFATTGSSAVVGTKISRAVNSLIPANVKNPAVHGALSIVSILGMALVSGNSLGANVLRGTLLGVGVQQGNVAVDTVVSPNLPQADTMPAKLLASAFKPEESLAGLQGLRSAYSPAVMQAFEEDKPKGFASI